MKYRNFARAAAGVLATTFLCGAALAQAARPQPPTMTDTAPPPAADRDSVGAVILMDEPVLARREQMQQAQERTAIDTRTLGAGPARVIRDTFEQQRALDAMEPSRGTPK